ncbi:DUF2975 domain-containing protein [Neobacillus mesonae]|uniref:DUF2975 domain-containing protein n=1 Tax=Neobacillus mesonae TaxID=1193713 RepID=UPI00203F5F32|nr:DUF2975 domain-containing protein [Neobacillus mesonae]MCM3567697.1 DUF2975 domain-containing protein [Neobacillus mesonae]
MKRRKITFLKAAVYLIGIVILSLCAFWLPAAAKNAAKLNPEYAYLHFPVLTGLYITAIPFFLALFEALKLLNYIKDENAFSELAVVSLGHIKKYAVSIIILYLLGILLLLFQNALHPGIAIAGFAIIFATVVICIFAALLQELLRSALEIKTENDLTV